MGDPTLLSGCGTFPVLPASGALPAFAVPAAFYAEGAGGGRERPTLLPPQTGLALAQTCWPHGLWHTAATRAYGDRVSAQEVVLLTRYARVQALPDRDFAAVVSVGGERAVRVAVRVLDGHAGL